jgi:hypothetical protein
MEKCLQVIKRLLAVGVVTLLFYQHSLAQCTGGVYAGDITPTLSWQTIPCIKGGEYFSFTATAGVFYTFSFCMGGGAAAWNTQITILDNSGNPAPFGFADNECGLQDHLWYWSPGTTGTYRVLITQSSCTSNTNCATLAYHTELSPYGGPGLSCGNPWVIPSLPYSQSGLTSCYYGNEYTSANACGSQYMNGEDFVMRYNGTAGECISLYTDNTFIYTGLFLVRGCPNAPGSTCVAYHEAAAGNPQLFNVTLPTTATYYIVFDMEGNTPPQCSPFDITIVNCVAMGQGANCATAFTIPSLPYSNVGFTTCGRGNTYTSAMPCGSSYMNGEDFVFRYVSPGNECVSIELGNTQPYTGFFVYNGCPSTVGTTCVAMQTAVGGNPKRRVINLTAAGTYYILVSNQPAPSCTPFNFTIKRCEPACTNNPNMNNTCSTPTLVSFPPGDTVCGFTSDTYTADGSADLTADFCGSIENNGWFSFIADSTTVTLRVDVNDCNFGYGIQGRVFETTDCINFTPRSNCWNPLIQTNGVIQATGLTVGNTYRLMLDGYAMDDCSFEIYRLGGALPVVWRTFSATLLEDDRVQIDWATDEEINSLGYYVQRGKIVDEGQGPHFLWENVTFVGSMGGPSQGATYQRFDKPEYTGEAWYYRIQQMDMDGVSSFTDYQRIMLAGPTDAQLRKVYPNPATNKVNVEFYSPKAGTTSFALYNLSGMLVKQISFGAMDQGVYEKEVQLDEFANGLYFYALSINGELFKGKLNIFH